MATSQPIVWLLLMSNFVLIICAGHESDTNCLKSTNTQTKCAKSNDRHDHFIIGFVVGCSIATVLVFNLALFYMPKTWLEKVIERRQEKKKKKKKTTTTKQKPVQARQLPTLNDKREGTQIHTWEKYITRMTFKYLLRATVNFSNCNVIGLGKQGILYKAAVGNGNFLAVKRFRDSQHLGQHFNFEIMTIGLLRHRNLLPLVGFCIERKERLLVYDYMANGSLYDWLHPPIEAKRTYLEWPLRARITIGIARGLVWLHHKSKYRIIHGNLSSKCILLDKNLDPKISNFERTVLDAPKMDVYAFGILLLEVITSKKPDDLSNSSKGFGGTLSEWVTFLLSTASFYDAIDKSLIGKGFDCQIYQFFNVASNCIHPYSSKRPTMLEVYKMLSAIGPKNGISGLVEEIE